ncbi:MAG: peptidase [Myxococcales bacterium]|nr:peptidase [Myxococcales bacterium]
MWPRLLVCSLLLVGASAHADPSGGVEGVWRGALGGRLHLVVTFSKSGDGKLGGVLESVDQGATLPMDSVTVTGSAVRFTIARIGGVYDGKLDTAGAALDGTWTQNGVPPQPLSFARDSGKSAAAQPPAPAGHARRTLDAPIEMAVPVAPTPFRGGDDKVHLVYEAHVTNFGQHELSLRRFEVLAPDGRALATLEATDLPAATDRPGLPPVPGDPLRVGPGLRAVIRVWVTLPDGASAPAAVDNQLTLVVGDDAEKWVVKQRLAVRSEAPIVIGPPLEGARWVAVNGPSNTSGHRGAMIPIGGRAWSSQRFAIDWVQVNAAGRTSNGDEKKNKSYSCYGAHALAVADGTVVATKDGLAENIPGPTRAVPITLETIGGNHVIVDVGGGRYALYAHLQPKSLRVKVGDHVKRGQLLGLVGNSGNSTEPHLHFHVADRPSSLAAEGLPYEFEQSKRLPLENELVDFPTRK